MKQMWKIMIEPGIPHISVHSGARMSVYYGAHMSVYYGACTLHARSLRLQTHTHTHNM